MKMDYLLHHLFLSSRDKMPQKKAVVDGEKTLTYHQLSERAGYLAVKLQEAGAMRGDRIPFFLDHNVDQAVAILAISVIGAVFVPVNALLYPDQVAHIINDSGARILITNRLRCNKLHKIMRTCPDLSEVLLMDDLDGARTLKRTCLTIEDDLAAILYTSGSTGRPKGVMISHKNLLAGCWIISEYLQLSDVDRLLGVLPLSFDYGLNQLLTMLAQGGTYYYLSFKFPNEIVHALEKHKITGFAGIPPIWTLLIRSSLARTSLQHLRYITNSGGAVPTTILEKLKQLLPGTDIFLMYGLTEAFRSTYLPPTEIDKRPTSIGKAIPNTEIFVVSKNGELCGPNEAGELVHRGPTVSLGFWNQPEETAKKFRNYPWNKDEIGFERVVFSGDLVKSDEKGFLYFIGRSDAMIKCSGHRISPSEIEEVVFKTGLVKEAAAIGIPDEVAGEIVKVFIVPINENKCKSKGYAKKIIDFCSEQMPNYMVPRHIESTDFLPKTVAGKIDYPGLREMSK